MACTPGGHAPLVPVAADPPTYSFNLDPSTGLPRSPYANADEACKLPPDTDLYDDWIVDGYPASPFDWSSLIFTRNVTQPPAAQRKEIKCRPGSGIAGAPKEVCFDAYEMDIYARDVDLGCPTSLTQVLTYNGKRGCILCVH